MVVPDGYFCRTVGNPEVTLLETLKSNSSYSWRYASP
jgi:hypothetical protein